MFSPSHKRISTENKTCLIGGGAISLLFRCVSLGLALTLSGFAESATVSINEFVASNGSVLADEDGDYEDWIELKNHGDQAVSLAGFGLSDDPSNPMRWVFPDVTLQPGEYLLVWASGKHRTNPAHPLHANFSISSEGEPLTLTDPNGVTTVDAVGPVRLGRDMAYGRVPDGTGEWHFFEHPTPSGRNETTAYEAWLQPPVFSHPSGFHANSLDLRLESTDPGATIVYTTDGSEPSAAGAGTATFNYKNRYPGPNQSGTGPILTAEARTLIYDAGIEIEGGNLLPNTLARITTTPDWNYPPAHMPAANAPLHKGMVVRARAIRDGSLPSEIVTRTYFTGAGGADTVGLPVVAVTLPGEALFDYDNGIYTPGRVYDDWWLNNPGERSLAGWRRPANYTRRGREWERAGHVEIFAPEAGRIIAQNAGIRVHGGASRREPMKSLRLYARRSYDTQDEFQHRFFDDLFDPYGRPVNAFKRIILRSGGNDNPQTRIRDTLFHTLLRPFGLDDQRHLVALHYINGTFWGHVDIRERIDRYYIASRHLISPGDVALLSYYHSAGVAVDGPQLEEGGEGDLRDFKDLLEFVETEDMKVPGNFAHVADQIDIDAFILYNVAQIYLGNYDWPHNNNEFWRKRVPDRRSGALPSHDGRWRWILTDLDFGFGMYRENPDHRTLAWALRDQSWGEDPVRVEATKLLRSLVKNAEFRNRLINAFADHMATTFAPDHVVGLIEEFESLIGPVRDGIHHERYRGRQGNAAQIPRLIDHARRRPAVMWSHIRSEFNLTLPFVDVTFDVNEPEAGTLRINTVRVDGNTPGLPDPRKPYPFSARYAGGVPLEVTALAREGFTFARWKEFPNEESNRIRIDPWTTRSLTAYFEPDPREPVTAAYWNFNDPSDLLSPNIGSPGAHLFMEPGPDTVVTDGGGNGFSGENARAGDLPGRHLRINNPLGSALEIHLPTTGLSAPVLAYEVRRSNRGPGRQLIAYSTDGVDYHEFAEIQVFAEDPLLHRFDFSGIEAAADNPDFRVRITFERGDNGGTEGNQRIDNLTLSGLREKPASIYHDSSPTQDLGGGWKWNGMGFLYDSYFPFVYLPSENRWIYVIGGKESGYFFHDHTHGYWAWTGSSLYPWYYILTGPSAGQWRSTISGES